VSTTNTYEENQLKNSKKPENIEKSKKCERQKNQKKVWQTIAYIKKSSNFAQNFDTDINHKHQ